MRFYVKDEKSCDRQAMDRDRDTALGVGRQSLNVRERLVGDQDGDGGDTITRRVGKKIG